MAATPYCRLVSWCFPCHTHPAWCHSEAAQAELCALGPMFRTRAVCGFVWRAGPGGAEASVCIKALNLSSSLKAPASATSSLITAALLRSRTARTWTRTISNGSRAARAAAAAPARLQLWQPWRRVRTSGFRRLHPVRMGCCAETVHVTSECTRTVIAWRDEQRLMSKKPVGLDAALPDGARFGNTTLVPIS